MSRRRATAEIYYKSLFALIAGVQLLLVTGGGIAQANGNYVTVTLDGRHRVRGQTEHTIYDNRPFVTFRGVPYAETPVGHLRFRVSVFRCYNVSPI